MDTAFHSLSDIEGVQQALLSFLSVNLALVFALDCLHAEGVPQRLQQSGFDCEIFFVLLFSLDDLDACLQHILGLLQLLELHFDLGRIDQHLRILWTRLPVNLANDLQAFFLEGPRYFVLSFRMVCHREAVQ